VLSRRPARGCVPWGIGGGADGGGWGASVEGGLGGLVVWGGRGVGVAGKGTDGGEVGPRTRVVEAWLFCYLCGFVGLIYHVCVIYFSLGFFFFVFFFCVSFFCLFRIYSTLLHPRSSSGQVSAWEPGDSAGGGGGGVSGGGFLFGCCVVGRRFGLPVCFFCGCFFCCVRLKSVGVLGFMFFFFWPADVVRFCFCIR